MSAALLPTTLAAALMLVAFAAAAAADDDDIDDSGNRLTIHPAPIRITGGVPTDSDGAAVDTVGFVSGRIAGGHNAAPHSAPYIVSVQWSPPGGGQRPRHYCGGSIIHRAWVVTAAHCLFGGRVSSRAGRLQLVAGAHNIRLPAIDDAATVQRRTVNRARAWSHPRYWAASPLPGPFDIGMVHVAPAFDFDPYVHAIRLPAAGAIPTGYATLHGWGATSGSRRGPGAAGGADVLQTVTQPIVPFVRCLAVYGFISPLHPTNVCAGRLTGGVSSSSSCGGDSGGPLAQDGVLVGLVSWGRLPCGSRLSPSVYVRISAFVPWMAEVQRLL